MAGRYAALRDTLPERGSVMETTLRRNWSGIDMTLIEHATAPRTLAECEAVIARGRQPFIAAVH